MFNLKVKILIFIWVSIIFELLLDIILIYMNFIN